MEGTPDHVLFRPFHNPLSLAIFFLHRRDGVRCVVQIVSEVVLVQVGFFEAFLAVNEGSMVVAAAGLSRSWKHQSFIAETDAAHNTSLLPLACLPCQPNYQLITRTTLALPPAKLSTYHLVNFSPVNLSTCQLFTYQSVICQLFTCHLVNFSPVNLSSCQLFTSQTVHMSTFHLSICHLSTFHLSSC